MVMYFRENVGLLGLTRVGSRRVVQISAGFMIFFSTLGWYYLFGVVLRTEINMPIGENSIHFSLSCSDWI